MPAPLVEVTAVILCVHGTPVQIITSNARVLLDGQPAAALADTYVVPACPGPPGDPAHKCVLVRWIVPAAEVLVNGQPAILQSSIGLCFAADQTPTGPPSIVMTQLKVVGT